MRRTKLTKQAVDALRSDGDELRIWDASISGFGVRSRGGGKYYFLKYRLPNGRQRWATIRRHGSPWTVETARKEALRLLGQIAEGEDPVDVKTTQRADLTVFQLCDLYLAQPVIVTNRGTAKRASSLEIDRSNIERHIKPLLGPVRLRALTGADIEKFQQDVAAGKSRADSKTKLRGRAIVSGGNGIAARSVAVLSTLLSFAVVRGLRADNPARSPASDDATARAVPLLLGDGSDGRGAFEARSKRREFDGDRGDQAVAAHRLPSRRNHRLAVAVIDFDRRCIRFPDSKTGAKTVPLGDPAIDLLAASQPSRDRNSCFRRRAGAATSSGCVRLGRKSGKSRIFEACEYTTCGIASHRWR